MVLKGREIPVHDVENWHPNKMLSWFLMTSYVYYVLGDRIMSDQDFDRMTQMLKDRYDEVEHIHKHLVTIDHLEASTGYDIDYPNMVVCAANSYMKELINGNDNEYCDVCECTPCDCNWGN